MLMTTLWWLLCHPQALELEYESPWSVTLEGLESGLTYWEWNWMPIRPRLLIYLQVTHNASPVTPVNIGGTVLKESDDLVILGVTFDYKKTFEKHLRAVSRAASQRLGILRESWRVFHDRSLLRRCFQGFVLLVLENCSAVWCLAADTHLKLLDRAVIGARFLTGICLSVTCQSSIRSRTVNAE